MTKDDDLNQRHLLLGDDFGEDEATALDLGVRREDVPVSDRAVGSGVESADEDEDDQTEIFRPLPPRADASAKVPLASGVVRIGEDGRKLTGRESGKIPASPGLRVDASSDTFNDEDEDAETLQLARPPSRRSSETSGVSGKTPRVRSLGELPHPTIQEDTSADPTLSRPRVVRMTFSPVDNHPPAGSSSAAFADTHKRSADAAGGDEAAEVGDDDATGRLIVEGGPEATIFVDGVERGRGSVTIDEVNRHRRFAVRVHKPGCRPWTRSVSLRGEMELRVVATPEPR